MEAFSQHMQGGGLLSYIDALSGGSVSRVGIFSLGMIVTTRNAYNCEEPPDAKQTAFVKPYVLYCKWRLFRHKYVLQVANKARRGFALLPAMCIPGHVRNTRKRVSGGWNSVG